MILKIIDFLTLVKYKLKAPYVPNASGKGDYNNFAVSEDSDEDEDVPSIKPSEDPFIEW